MSPLSKYINLSQVSSFREALRLDVYWDLLSVQLIVYPIIRGGGGEARLSGGLKISLCVDRILKDIQNLKCEDKSLVLKTEDSANKWVDDLIKTPLHYSWRELKKQVEDMVRDNCVVLLTQTKKLIRVMQYRGGNAMYIIDMMVLLIYQHKFGHR